MMPQSCVSSSSATGLRSSCMGADTSCVGPGGASIVARASWSWTPGRVGAWMQSAQGVGPTLTVESRARRGSSRQCGRLLGVLARLEQRQRVEVELAGDALEALERQVALASLDAAHVGAVDAELFGKRLLAEAAGLPMGAQVVADSTL